MTTIHARRRVLPTLARYSGRGQGERRARDKAPLAVRRAPSHLPSTSLEYVGTPAYRPRGEYAGLLQILKFNWPSYAVGGAVVLATLIVLPRVRLPLLVRASVSIGLALA